MNTILIWYIQPYSCWHPEITGSSILITVCFLTLIFSSCYHANSEVGCIVILEDSCNPECSLYAFQLSSFFSSAVRATFSGILTAISGKGECIGWEKVDNFQEKQNRKKKSVWVMKSQLISVFWVILFCGKVGSSEGLTVFVLFMGFILENWFCWNYGYLFRLNNWLNYPGIERWVFSLSFNPWLVDSI